MPKFTHISAVALRDDAKLIGLVLRKDGTAEIDILDSQVGMVQAAVDAGDVAVAGFKAADPAEAPAAVVETPKASKK